MIEKAGRTQLGLEERKKTFIEIPLGEDVLGVVIRAHIYIEHELIAFIEARLRPSEALDAIELDYSSRVKLAVALGLSNDYKAALTFIDTLRNRFAHSLDARIDKQVADNFEKALGPNNEIAKKAHLDLRVGTGPDRTVPPIGQLDPKSRIILYLVVLWSGIAVAAAEVRKAAS